MEKSLIKKVAFWPFVWLHRCWTTTFDKWYAWFTFTMLLSVTLLILFGLYFPIGIGLLASIAVFIYGFGLPHAIKYEKFWEEYGGVIYSWSKEPEHPYLLPFLTGALTAIFFASLYLLIF